METYDGVAFCINCKQNNSMVNGVVKVSDSGRRMALGICPICGTKVNRILGKEPEVVYPELSAQDATGKTAVQVIAAQIGDPNLYQMQQMAERVLTVLLEIDPDIENKLELWDDKRVEKKMYKKWRKKIGAEIANDIAQLNLDVMVASTPLLLEAIVNLKREAIHIAKGE